MQTQLTTGILHYCGVPKHRLELLHGGTEGEPQTIEAAARALGAAF